MTPLGVELEGSGAEHEHFGVTHAYRSGPRADVQYRMVIALTILSPNLLAVVVVALMITIRFACERTRRNVYIYASVPIFRLLFSAYYAFSPVSASLCSYA